MKHAYAAVLGLAALAASCTTIGHEKVSGWPELRIVERHVPHDELVARCSRYVRFAHAVHSCAEFDFVSAECHVWFSRDYPPHPYVVAHERLHCQGYDHPGERTLSRLLQRHVASLPPELAVR